MRYSNIPLYIVQKKRESLPTGCERRELGEGVNRGKTTDGRLWTKDCFRTPDELRAIVHAEDAGLLDIKSAVEMRALLPKETAAVAGPAI